jgi:hypothetical protein
VHQLYIVTFKYYVIADIENVVPWFGYTSTSSIYIVAIQCSYSLDIQDKSSCMLFFQVWIDLIHYLLNIPTRLNLSEQSIENEVAITIYNHIPTMFMICIKSLPICVADYAHMYSSLVQCPKNCCSICPKYIITASE